MEFLSVAIIVLQLFTADPTVFTHLCVSQQQHIWCVSAEHKLSLTVELKSSWTQQDRRAETAAEPLLHSPLHMKEFSDNIFGSAF